MPTAMMSPLEIKLREEVRSELEHELRDAMHAEAERRIASAQDAAEQWHRDAMAKYQKDVERDIDGRVEQEAERLWRNRRDEFLDRLENLKERADAAETRATTLAAGLQALTLGIWPELDKYKAIARHCSITEINLAALSPALELLGMRLAGRVSDSEHTIALLMPPHGVQMVTLLALKKNLPVTTDNRAGETPIHGPSEG